MTVRLRFILALLIYFLAFVWVNSGGRFVDSRVVLCVFVASTVATVALSH